MKKYTIEAKEHMNNVDYFGGNRDSELNNLVKDIKATWGIANKYRYAGDVSKTTVLTRYVKALQVKKQVVPGGQYIVKLGGPFEEVGEQKDTVGGNSQKVG